MKILPFYGKKVTVYFSRGDKKEKLELVETDGSEVRNLITELFSGRFSYPGNGNNKQTRLSIAEYDEVNKVVSGVRFIYTKRGVVREQAHAYIANLSPMQVKIELETAVRKMK